MLKRITSFFMTIVMLFSLLALTAMPASAASFSGGDGSRNNPYLISTKAQLETFRDLVNGGRNNLCAKLIADIDLRNDSWTPIGLTKTGYTGVFDGCGHLVSNLYLDSISNVLEVRQSDGEEHEVQVSGLFGVVGSSGTVRCVGISGVVTGDLSASNSTGVYIGSLAGCVFGMVEECFSVCNFTDLTVYNNDYIGLGGLIGIGLGSGVIRNCYNTGSIDATVKASSSDHNIYLGGLIGLVDCELRNSYCATPIYVSITRGRQRLGGVTGNAGGIDMSNCYYDAQVCSAKYSAGCCFTNSNPFDPTYCNGKTTAVLRSDKMPSVLGNVFRKDVSWVNDGYPILAVMTYGQEEDTWSEWFEDEAMGTNIDREVFNALIPPELQNRDLTKDITRVEFCAVAVELYEEMGGKKLDAGALVSPFVDTSSDAVKKAYFLGITNGVSDTSFDPYTNISREQLATMLTRVYKALNLPGWTLATDSRYKLDYSGTTPFADDRDISGYAKPSVYFMVKNEVIKGIAPNIFGPRNVTSAQEAIGYANASREQALIMAVRMFNKL